jgi:uncharacterized repeat protein (TIGR01451 family)
VNARIYFLYIIAVALLAPFKSGATLQPIFTNNVSAAVASIDWSHNHDFLAVGYVAKLTSFDELQIYRWRTNSLPLTNSVDTGTRSVAAVAWRRDAYQFAYGTESHTTEAELRFHVFNSTNGKLTNSATVEIGAAVRSISWRPAITNNHVIVGIGDNGNEYSIYRYDNGPPATSTLVFASNLNLSRSVITNGIAWNRDGKRYAIGLYDANSPEVLIYSNSAGNTHVLDDSFDYDSSYTVTSIDWHTNGSALAVGMRSLGLTNNIKIYRVESNQTYTLLTAANLSNPPDTVHALAWGPFDNLLAMGINNPTNNYLGIFRVNLTGTGALEPLYRRELATTLDVKALKWSRDGKYLAVGTSEGTSEITGGLTIYQLLTADLAIRKTNSPSLARPGSNLVYTIVVTNSGPNSITNSMNMYVRDLLPTGLTYVAATSTYGGIVTVTGSVVTVAYPVFNVNSSATIGLTVAVNGSLRTILTNSVSVHAGIADPNVTNNTFTLLTYTDFDGDGIPDVLDKCPEFASANNTDSDSDGLGNVCDNCPTNSNANQLDVDIDGVGDVCDNCPTNFNPGQIDVDIDGIGNDCDSCPFVFNPGTNQVGPDTDMDGVLNLCDNCPTNINPDQLDFDTDGIGNACDNCLNVTNPAQTDIDGDDIGDDCDSCPDVFNPGDGDLDVDGIGDACDPDKDGDQLPNDWEIAYGFNPANDNVNDFETDLDPDNDGYSNLEEFIAGTHPVDGASTPVISAIESAGNITITWPSTTGRYYDVLYATNLMADQWLFLTSGLTGPGTNLSLSVTNTWLERYFRYKVDLVP